MHAKNCLLRPRLIPACAGKTPSLIIPFINSEAHPRVCGENEHFIVVKITQLGSSPRVRGKLKTAATLTGLSGLIPACAGKTSLSPTSTRPRTAHPRVCGENQNEADRVRDCQGSSPRVRGKLCRSRYGSRNSGLIPACAGKTASWSSATSMTRAHPRVCGENASSRPSHERSAGSSPRVRGKHRLPCLRGTNRRLIPACAGKTWNGWKTSPTCPAHPRVCGENSPASMTSSPATGSSPRVRGKRAEVEGRRRVVGLIPACAGKTPVRGGDHFKPPAHPRVCGENSSEGSKAPASQGSSPRVRGKLGGLVGYNFVWGLIPACAGKTLTLIVYLFGVWAHPRVCGENSTL